MEKETEVALLKKENINLIDENKLYKKELEKIDYLVKLNHFGSKGKGRVKTEK